MHPVFASSKELYLFQSGMENIMEAMFPKQQTKILPSFF
jgi:hypothetical protein